MNSSETTFAVIKDGIKYTVSEKICRKWYPAGRKQGFLVKIKVVGWKAKNRRQCEIHYKLISDGQHQDVWIKRSRFEDKVIPKSVWKEIIARRKDRAFVK